MIKCIILDFDGTLSDVWSQSERFEAHYKAGVADTCHQHHITAGDFNAQWDTAAEAVATTPALQAWKYDGHAVAPAQVDPFLHAGAVANHLLDTVGLLPDPEARRNVLQPLFMQGYALAEPALRPGLKDAVEALQATGALCVVITNADGTLVQERLTTLGLDIPVRGNARKYAIGDAAGADFTGIAETTALPDLQRPILLRRGAYRAALAEVWKQCGAGPTETLVAGDIFEMDLALPAALGAYIHLMEHQGTRPHERTAAALHPRGSHGKTLEDLVSRVEALSGR